MSDEYNTNDNSEMVNHKDFSLAAKGLRNKKFLYVSIGVFIVVVLMVAGYFVYQKVVDSAATVETDLEGLSAEELTQKSAQYAEKLKANPPGSDATEEQLTDYYFQFILNLSKDTEIIAAYDTSVGRDVTLLPASLVRIAQSYVNRNQESDKNKALGLLNQARQYIKANRLDIDKNGLTTGELEWIDEKQMEMGL